MCSSPGGSRAAMQRGQGGQRGGQRGGNRGSHRSSHRSNTRGQRGFTLPEAILAIVVLGVGLTGLLLAFSTVARNSADPVLRKQAVAIAQELIEEITLQPYASAANTAPGGCARDTYNDVSDYHGYTSTGVCTVDGVAIAALAAFNVGISVAAGTLGGVAAARKITVTVTQGGESLSLVSWRTDYASP